MAERVNINTDIITWAIKRAGYNLYEFAETFPKVKVIDWIENKNLPTLKQLENFSNKVYLPFGYLFLPEPPKEDLPIPFFRTNNTKVNHVSINVYDTISLLQRRQDWLRDYLQENEFDALEFVGKFNVQSNYLSIVQDIREIIGLANDWTSKAKNWTDALEILTQKIENAGIITIFNSVVENNTSRPIKVNECRGFVLVDDIAPFMFINSADSKSAQMFTIVHELAHIWLGKSAGFDFDKMLPANDPIELLCNQVAAEFLVPELIFSTLWKPNKKNIMNLARHFKVSPIVIARRALDLGKINKPQFFKFYNSYLTKEKAKNVKSQGGNFYATTKKRLSPTFAAYIKRAVNTNQLLYRDAYKLTGLKGETYQKFFNDYFFN